MTSAPANENVGPRWGVMRTFADLLSASLLSGRDVSEALHRAKFLPVTYTPEEKRLIELMVASDLALAGASVAGRSPE